jgi:hypothetical protein
VKSLGPEFEADWNRDFAPFPTRPLMLCGVVNAFLADPSLVEPGQYMTMGTYTVSDPPLASKSKEGSGGPRDINFPPEY